MDILNVKIYICNNNNNNNKQQYSSSYYYYFHIKLSFKYEKNEMKKKHIENKR